MEKGRDKVRSAIKVNIFLLTLIKPGSSSKRQLDPSQITLHCPTFGFLFDFSLLTLMSITKCALTIETSNQQNYQTDHYSVLSIQKLIK